MSTNHGGAAAAQLTGVTTGHGSGTACSVAPRPGLIETDLGQELILLDPTTQQMYSLNAVGRLIWGGLASASPAEIVGGVVAAFDVDRATAEADLRALLRELDAAGLVVPIG